MAATTTFYGSLHALQGAIGIIVDVDTRLTDLKKVMDQDTNFDKVMASATTSAEKFGKTITETLDAYVEFSKQGYKEQDLVNLGEAGIIASNVGEISTKQAADYLTSTLIQWQKDSSEAMGVIDSFNEISNNYATTVEKLAQGNARAAATAKAFGLDMHELNAIVGSVTASTKQSGNEIGNFIKNVLPRLTSQPAGDALNLAGVSLTDENGDMRDAIEIYREVAKEFVNMNKMNKAIVAEGLAGKYHISRMTAFLQDLGSANSMYEQMLETSRNSQGSAERENDRYMQSLQARINLVKESFEQLALAMGDAFLTEGFIGFLSVAKSFAESMTSITKTVGGLPLILGILSASILLISKSFRGAVVEGRVFNSTMVGLGVTAKGLSLALKTAFASTGIGLIFVGIGVAIEKVMGHFSKLRQQTEELQLKNKELTDSYKQNKKTIDELLPQYQKYEKLINSGDYHNDDLQKYNELKQELAQLMPSLIIGEDSYGNSIIGSSDHIKAKITLMERQLEIQEKIAANEAKETAQDNYDTAKKNLSKLEKEFAGMLSGSPTLIGMSIDDITKKYETLKNKIADGKKLDVLEQDQFEYLGSVIDKYGRLGNEIELAKLTHQSASLEMIKNTLTLDDSTTKAVDTLVDSFMTFVSVSEVSGEKINGVFDSLYNSIENDQSFKNTLTEYGNAIDMFTKKQQEGLSEEQLEEYRNKAIETFEVVRNELLKIAKNQGIKGEDYAYLKTQIDSTSLSLSNLGKKQEDASATTRMSADEVNASVAIFADGAEGLDGMAFAADNLSESLKEANGDLEKLNHITKDLAKQGNTDGAFDILMGEAYDSASESVSVYNGLLEDMAEGKSLTASEAMELISQEEDLAKAISVENGIVTVNIDKVTEMRNKKVKAYTDIINAVKQEVLLQHQALLQKIGMYKDEVLAIQTVADAEAKANEARQKKNEAFESGAYQFGVAAANQEAALVDLSGELERLDKLSGLTSQSLDEVGTSFEDSADETKKAKDELKSYKYIADKFKKTMDGINLSIEKNNALMDNYSDYSAGYRQALLAELDLLDQKQTAIDNQTKSLQEQIATGNVQQYGVVEDGRGQVTAPVGSYNVNSKVTGNSGIAASHIAPLLKGDMAGTADYIIKYAKEYGIDPAFLVALMINETGRDGTSTNSKYFNFGNRKNTKGGWMKFSSKEEGVKELAAYLKRKYTSKGVTTIDGIHNIYAPKSDSRNSTWGTVISSVMNEITSGISTAVSSAVTTATKSVSGWNVAVTSGYGKRTHPVTGEKDKMHHGVDLAFKQGSNLQSNISGEVVWAQAGSSPKGSSYSGYGGVVAVKDSQGNVHVYAHMSEVGVQKGQVVDVGTSLGKTGGAKGTYGAGTSNGAHLHYEVRKNGQLNNTFDPMQYVNQAKSGKVSSSYSYASSGNASKDLAEIEQAIDSAKSDLNNLDSESLQVQQRREQILNELIRYYSARFSKKEERIGDNIADIASKRENGNLDPTSEAFRKSLQQEVDQIVQQRKQNTEEIKFFQNVLNTGMLEGRKLNEAQLNQIKDLLADANQQANDYIAQQKATEKAIVDSRLNQFDKQKDNLQTLIDNSAIRLERYTEGSTAYNKELENQLKLVNRKNEANKQEIEYLTEVTKTHKLTGETAAEYEERLKSLRSEGHELIKLQKELNREIERIKLDKIFTKINKEYDKLNKNIEKLDRQLGKLDNDDYDSRMELSTQKLKEYLTSVYEAEFNIASLKKQLEKVTDQASIDELKEKIEEWEKELTNATYAAEDLRHEMNELRKDMADEIIDTMKEYYQSQIDFANEAYDNESERLEELHEDKMKYYDEEIDKINKVYDAKLKSLRDEVDGNQYKKEYDNIVKERQKVQNKLNLLSADGSKEAAVKRKELNKELDELNLQLEELTYNRSNELREKHLEEERTTKLEELENKREEEQYHTTFLDKEFKGRYEDVKKWLEAERKAHEKSNREILDNERYWSDMRNKILSGDLASIESELQKFVSTASSKFGILGNSIQQNLIDHLKEAISLMQTIGTVDIGAIDGNKNAGAGGKFNNADFKLLAGKFFAENLKLYDEGHRLAAQARNEGSTVDPHGSYSLQELLNKMTADEKVLFGKYLADVVHPQYRNSSILDYAHKIAGEGRQQGSQIGSGGSYADYAQNYNSNYSNSTNTGKLKEEDFDFLMGKYLYDNIASVLPDANKEEVKNIGRQFATLGRNKGSQLDPNNAGYTFSQLTANMKPDEKVILAKMLRDKVLFNLTGAAKEALDIQTRQLAEEGRKQGSTIPVDMSWNEALSKYNIASMDTGGYTGEFSGGKFLLAHEKELMLNQTDTENVLDTVQAARGIAEKFNLKEVLKSVDLVKNFMVNIPKLQIPQLAINQGATDQNINLNVNIDKITGGQDGANSFFKEITTRLSKRGIQL